MLRPGDFCARKYYYLWSTEACCKAAPLKKATSNAPHYFFPFRWKYGGLFVRVIIHPLSCNRYHCRDCTERNMDSPRAGVLLFHIPCDGGRSWYTVAQSSWCEPLELHSWFPWKTRYYLVERFQFSISLGKKSGAFDETGPILLHATEGHDNEMTHALARCKFLELQPVQMNMRYSEECLRFNFPSNWGKSGGAFRTVPLRHFEWKPAILYTN